MTDRWPLHPNVMSYSIAEPEQRVMNLHDFILSVDAKREGVKLMAAGRTWTVGSGITGVVWYLEEEESGATLWENVWAALPSEGWSVVDAES